MFNTKYIMTVLILAAHVVFIPEAVLAAKRYALVIGNSEYDGGLLTPLKNPTNDAAIISDALKQAGFEVSLIANATQMDMKRAIKEFGDQLSKSGPDTVGLFYFAGHGLQAKSVNYLVPIKANLQSEADAEIEAVSVEWVIDQMEYAKNKTNIVILDACRNNALASSSRSGKRGLALVRGPQGSFVAFATEPGGVAADGAGLNSPYSTAIAQEIRRPGASIESVFKNVRKSVIKETQGEQIPWDYSSLTSDFYFIPGEQKQDQTASLSPSQAGEMKDLQARQIELQLWNDVKDSSSPDQLQSYISKYPNGTFVETAKARIKALKEQFQPANTLPYQDIHERFATMTQRGQINEQTDNPLEFYANAQLLELKGDYIKSRRSYIQFLGQNLAYVDPHYKFQSLLKVQDGSAGAREVYQELARKTPNFIMSFAHALLLDQQKRIARLEAIIKAQPDFAPAYYELSRDFSEDRLGTQSVADKKRESELLKKFTELEQKGHFIRYFIDQRLAVQQIEDAKKRLTALSTFSESAMQNPVSILAMAGNQGWSITLSIADQAQEIFYALPGKDFKSTGFMQGVMHPQTGKPLPNGFFSLANDTESMTFQVKYIDLKGKEQGPYQVNFDPDAALVSGQKDILERFNTNWVSIHKGGRRTLVYFTHLISYRCAIENISYGINSEIPNKKFPLEDCNKKNPYSVTTASGGDSTIYLEFPNTTEFVTVQLTYKDGTRSEVQKFKPAE